MVHNRRAFDDAGVVHEDVHAPAVLDDLRDDFGGALLGELAEILGVGVEFGAQFLRLRAGFRLVADVHADGVRAFAGEGERDGLADAPAGAGDDGDFVFKSFCVINYIVDSAGTSYTSPIDFQLPVDSSGLAVACLTVELFYRKSSGFTPSMSSNVWFSPAMPQMNL